MAAGSPPPRTNSSARTALAWVADSRPPASRVRSSRYDLGSSAGAASASVAASLAVRARARAEPTPAGHRRDHQVVQAQVDHGGDLVALGVGHRAGSAQQADEPRPALGRHHAEGVPHRPDPLGVGHQRDQVRLEEVPVVVGVLLGPQRLRPPGALVPVARLLHDVLARLEQGDLPLGLVLDGPAEGAHRVEVLDLAAGAEGGRRGRVGPRRWRRPASTPPPSCRRRRPRPPGWPAARSRRPGPGRRCACRGRSRSRPGARPERL